ncbi:alginate lyase family protein [Paenibacillus oryzisoli]|uniref:alginate lyase family protein n=1 Tax=Paenibacillus oryzisoli TaxID=1850517 RepID=UPI003D2A6C9B
MENNDNAKTNWETARQLIDVEAIMREAEVYLTAPTIQITDAISLHSPGNAHDYYSNGDYWWPNPDTKDGLPYIRRDGQSNPNNFNAHRESLRRMRTRTACLTSAFRLSGERRFGEKAIELLAAFFIDEATRMNPHLRYAQAIPGVCEGRGIGIIDTLHLIDAAAAVQVLQISGEFDQGVLQNVTGWFAAYLNWMNTHPQGIEERSEPNNHGVCWFVQAAAFARLTDDARMLAWCREQFKTRLLPEQMDLSGGFPRELARTKPYAYSLFTLDNFVTLAQLLSVPGDNLWTYELPDGRGIRQGMSFLLPYIENKSEWPYGPDIEYEDDWPVGMSFMLFAGLAYGSERLLHLWRTLDKNPRQAEVRRNMAIRQPLLWLL